MSPFASKSLPTVDRPSVTKKANSNPAPMFTALVVALACGGTKNADTPEQPLDSSATATPVSLPSPPASTPSTAVTLDQAAVSSEAVGVSSGSGATGSPPQTVATVSRCSPEAALVSGGSYQRAGAKEPKTLMDLCVDVLETTVTDYAQCVAAGQCSTSGLECSAQSTWNRAGKEQQPIVCIEYDQAAAYCAYRGKRLPSIEEWEWVARSGTEARTYSWGNEAPNEQLCWTGKRRQTESCVVGTHPEDRNAAGVFDMAGNVLEFVTTERDVKSPLRIAKGGAWNGGDAALFTNTRMGGFRKEYRCGFLGVRCVQEAKPIVHP